MDKPKDLCEAVDFLNSMCRTFEETYGLSIIGIPHSGATAPTDGISFEIVYDEECPTKRCVGVFFKGE